MLCHPQPGGRSSNARSEVLGIQRDYVGGPSQSAVFRAARWREPTVKKPHIEVECKLIARDASALKGVRQALQEVCSSVRHLGREVIRDAYVDTRDWRLYHAGYACRIRRTSRLAPGRAVLGLKSLQRAQRGVSTREEHERIVPSSPYRRGLSDALRHEGDLGEKILGILEGQKTRIIFRIRNWRETYAVRFGKRLRAHVSLDDFTLMAGTRRRRLAEVEIEIKQGSTEKLRELARLLIPRVGLSTQTRAKFKEGLDLAGLTPSQR
jgi:inorganic triphosphatase YgiF